MKKTVWVVILLLVFAVSSLCGCQNKEVQDLPTNEANEPIQPEDDSVDEVPESPPPAESPVQDAPDANPAEEISEPDVPDEPSEETSSETSTPVEESTSAPDFDYYYMGNRYGMGGNPSSSTLFEQADGLSRLKQYYEELYQVVDRVEFHNQSLDYVGIYTGDIKFTNNGTANGYGDDGNYHTQLQTFIIGRYVYNALSDCIEAGNNFDDEDFTVSSVTDSIPIILGYQYMDVYSVGDEITLSLHTQPLNFVVIGFLKENTSFAFGENSILLDQKIVVPFYDIAYEPIDEVNKIYQQIYHLQKCEGYICIDSSSNAEEIFNDVLELAEKYDLLFAVTPKKVERVAGL